MMKNYNYSFGFFLEKVILASDEINVFIPREIEYYIICNLEKSLQNKELSSNTQINDFLNGNEQPKKIADNCLIISGMFPTRCSHIGGGDITPIIWTGTQAYYLEHSKTNETLFLNLAEGFIQYMDIILVMNHMTEPFLLQEKTLKQLTQVGSKFPNYFWSI